MASNFMVVDQMPATIRTASGNIEDGVQITFTTKPSGVTGVVRVPASQYTPAEVEKILSAQAAIIEQVHRL